MGLLDQFRNRTPKAAPAQTTNLGMVALRGVTPVDWQRLGKEVARRFPGVDPESSDQWRVANEPGRKTQAGVLPIPGGQVMYGYMPIPIPWGDLDWPCKTAWHWREAEAALRPHQAHLIVAVSSRELAPLALAQALTQAIAATLAATDAAGVYYGNASLVLAPEAYLATAEVMTPSSPPLGLWLGFHPVLEEGKCSAYTTGMEVFGLLNLEAHDTDLSPPDLLGRLAEIADYEIRGGVQIADGETVGGSAEERLQVRHRRSRYGNRKTTCQITF